jgi:ABC-type Mn2+/Zn2+ transport system permease subunit
VIGLMLGTKMQTRLMIGWIAGIFASLIGIIASAVFDFPTGAAIVAAFGLLFALTLIKQSVE